MCVFFSSSSIIYYYHWLSFHSQIVINFNQSHICGAFVLWKQTVSNDERKRKRSRWWHGDFSVAFCKKKTKKQKKKFRFLLNQRAHKCARAKSGVYVVDVSIESAVQKPPASTCVQAQLFCSRENQLLKWFILISNLKCMNDCGQWPIRTQ